MKALLSLGQHLGLDYDIGLRLKTLVEELGLKDVSQNEHQYELAPDFARDLLIMTLKDWRGPAIKEKVMLEEEYAFLEVEIQQLSKPFWISKSIYITGSKP